MPGIASAATPVIGHVAGGTKTIRVGADGVMLPNHSPLVIAEQFGTLASLYPDRIDLGLGRAPGTDQPTARALRRNIVSTSDGFPQDVEELQSFRTARAESKDSRHPSLGPSRASLATRIESLQRATCSRARSAFCICIAFCACGDDAGHATLSHALQAIAATRPPVRHAGPERHCR
jgi:luciferase family oxidoreductase group 1